jgi:nucleotide sugar dehydrogenase
MKNYSVQEHNLVTVCIQGLGFVGTAMAVAVANACNTNGEPYFRVFGVDLPTTEGRRRVEAINAGILPFETEDEKLSKGLQRAHRVGNLLASTDPNLYSQAAVIVVDVHLDVVHNSCQSSLSLDGFQAAIRTLGEKILPGCLVIVETTVPPGACERIVAPELANAFAKRDLPKNAILLAHSYERVMPGKEYYNSIVNIYRVYAGHTTKAADICEAFLAKVINVNEYPLTRLSSTTASEIGKVLENSYRATNIAFIEEWGRFAEAAGVDLFEVISAIRLRPTHSNIRHPGFGVGGYCLTKDPLLAKLGAKELLGLEGQEFPFSTLAVTTNASMPLVSLNKVQQLLGGTLDRKTILLLGVSYRQDVGDTRNSPSQIFVQKARERGASIICHDPFVGYWPELEIRPVADLPELNGIDAVVLAVPHNKYKSLDFLTWLNGANPLIFDANDVLSKGQREALRKAGCRVSAIGRGEGL